MKKHIITVLLLVLSTSFGFAAYQPSSSETAKVSQASSAIFEIIESKYDGDYQILLSALKTIQPKVAMNKKKAWIVDTLITTTMDRISMKDGEMMKNEMMDKNDEMMKENMMHKDDMMKHTVSLENVVGSTTIRGITFNGNETGSASATSDTSGTHVYAHFDDLPSAGNNNFYEGWIVRTTNGLSVLSTGELEYKDGKYVNDWHTTDDIADHTFYVLTLEPNDGDPAPADHILEAHVK